MREKIEAERLTCECGCGCRSCAVDIGKTPEGWRTDEQGRHFWGEHKPKPQPKPQSAVIARCHVRPSLPDGISLYRDAGDAYLPERLIDIGTGCRAVLLTEQGFEAIKRWIQFTEGYWSGKASLLDYTCDKTRLDAARAVGVAI